MTAELAWTIYSKFFCRSFSSGSKNHFKRKPMLLINNEAGKRPRRVTCRVPWGRTHEAVDVFMGNKTRFWLVYPPIEQSKRDVHIFFAVDVIKNEPIYSQIKKSNPFLFARDCSILRRCQGGYRIGAVKPVLFLTVWESVYQKIQTLLPRQTEMY